jgi:hypothetical protein
VVAVRRAVRLIAAALVVVVHMAVALARRVQRGKVMLAVLVAPIAVVVVVARVLLVEMLLAHT